MSDKEKPLPKPPGTPFGRKKPFEEDEETAPLTADQMAQAMAEGRLEEFLQKELPDSEYARALAKMMMGMTGMLPPQGVSAELKKDETKPPVSQPPEDVINAAQSGDVKGLIELLSREHKKRIPDAGTSPMEEEKKTSPSPDQPLIEKDIIDELIKIASDNNLSVDWLVFRAIKRYIQEYRKTGQL